MRLKFVTFILAALVVVPSGVWAQNAMQKMAQVKDGIQANQAALKTYKYQQHTQIYYKSEVKSQKNYSVVTGPDGKPQKTSLDPPTSSAPPAQDSGRRGGRMKKDIVEKKVAGMKEYMEKA